MGFIKLVVYVIAEFILLICLIGIGGMLGLCLPYQSPQFVPTIHHMYLTGQLEMFTYIYVVVGLVAMGVSAVLRS